MGFFYVVFCTLLTVCNSGEQFADGKYGFDEWHMTNRSDTKELTKTAGPVVKSFKVAAYMSEVICGLFLLWSHYLVWHGCEERTYDLAEHLLHMSRESLPMSAELSAAIAEDCA